MIAAFLLGVTTGHAQEAPKEEPVKYVVDPGYLLRKTTVRPDFEREAIDTSILGFQNYYPRNTSGNMALPSAPLFLRYQKQELGFKLYDLPYANDLIANSQVGFFRSKGPYASLTGIAGGRQEQWLKAFFSHTFKNQLNISLALNRYSGLGFYYFPSGIRPPLSFANNFYVSSNYSSPNGRAGYNFYFLFNRLKHREIGGIKNDSLFVQDPTVTKTLLPLNIYNARRDNRLMSVYANPWLRLNKTEDSSTVLSHFVDYEFRYSGNFFKYTDARPQADGFYNQLYLDTLTTRDSTHQRQINNQLNYTLRINPLNLRLKLGYRFEIDQVYQLNDSLFNNHLLLGSLDLHRKFYTGTLSASYVAAGANKTDYQLELANRVALQLGNEKKNSLLLSLNLLSEQRHANYIYNTWRSNNFMWSNHFSSTQTQQAALDISYPAWRASLGGYFQNTGNYLYFDYLARPQQYDGNIQNFSVYAKKDWLIARHLGFDNMLSYQGTSDTNLVRIPSLALRSALYYQGFLFHKNLWLQIGFQAEFYSAFTGYAYMPATNSFYLQNTKRTGNYPYVDFFLSARIKPVRVFVKLDHAFMGMLGGNYTLAAGYIQPDRTVKFGFNWVFFD